MEEFKGDKRTKEYREWKAKFEAKQDEKPDGLGDVVKSITKATGIDKLVKWIAGDDCGCKERQKEFNKMFPFQKPNCLTEEEYEWLTSFIRTKKIRVTFDERQHLFEVYNRVFGTKLQPTSCPSCITNMINKLKAILKTYE